MNTKTVCRKAFYIEFDAIIELCSGFEAYFEKHPEQERDFPTCNAPTHKKIKSREMFVGKKTESFSKLLEVMSISVDSAYLEAEYYLTPAGKGRVYEYENDSCSIAFDFRIDPTAQIECCGISLSFPEGLYDQVMPLINTLRTNSKHVVGGVIDGGFNSQSLRTESTGNTSNNDWKEFKNRLENEKITHSKTRARLEKVFYYLKIAFATISVIVLIIKILNYYM